MFLEDWQANLVLRDDARHVDAAEKAIRVLTPGDVCIRPSTRTFESLMMRKDGCDLKAGDIFFYSDEATPVGSLDARYLFDGQDPLFPLVNVAIHSFGMYITGTRKAESDIISGGLLFSVKPRQGPYGSNIPKPGAPPNCFILGDNIQFTPIGKILTIPCQHTLKFVGSDQRVIARIDEVQLKMAAAARITQTLEKGPKESESSGTRYFEQLQGAYVNTNMTKGEFNLKSRASLVYRRCAATHVGLQDYVDLGDGKLHISLLMMAGSSFDQGNSSVLATDTWTQLKVQTKHVAVLKELCPVMFENGAANLFLFAQGKFGIGLDLVPFEAFAKVGMHVNEGLVSILEENDQRTRFAQQVRNLAKFLGLEFGEDMSRILDPFVYSLEYAEFFDAIYRTAFLYYTFETRFYSAFTIISTQTRDAVPGFDIGNNAGCVAFLTNYFSVASFLTITNEPARANWKRYASVNVSWKADLRSPAPSGKRPIAVVTPPGNSGSPPQKVAYLGRGSGSGSSACGYRFLELCGIKYGPAYKTEVLRNAIVSCTAQGCKYEHLDGFTKEKGAEILAASPNFMVKNHAEEVRAFLDAMV